MPAGEAHGMALWANTVPMTDEGLLDHLANSKLECLLNMGPFGQNIFGLPLKSIISGIKQEMTLS